MNAVVSPKADDQKLGSKIDELYELRERKRELAAEVKGIDEIMKAIEAEIMRELDEVGLVQGKGTRASATVNEAIVPEVVDWDAVHEYILENKALYLLTQNVAAAPWRELLTSGQPVPGTQPFTRRTLSLRKR